MWDCEPFEMKSFELYEINYEIFGIRTALPLTFEPAESRNEEIRKKESFIETVALLTHYEIASIFEVINWVFSEWETVMLFKCLFISCFWDVTLRDYGIKKTFSNEKILAKIHMRLRAFDSLTLTFFVITYIFEL